MNILVSPAANHRIPPPSHTDVECPHRHEMSQLRE